MYEHALPHARRSCRLTIARGSGEFTHRDIPLRGALACQPSVEGISVCRLASRSETGTRACWRTFWRACHTRSYATPAAIAAAAVLDMKRVVQLVAWPSWEWDGSTFEWRFANTQMGNTGWCSRLFASQPPFQAACESKPSVAEWLWGCESGRVFVGHEVVRRRRDRSRRSHR